MLTYARNILVNSIFKLISPECSLRKFIDILPDISGLTSSLGE
jgi:hypothetical protein